MQTFNDLSRRTDINSVEKEQKSPQNFIQTSNKQQFGYMNKKLININSEFNAGDFSAVQRQYQQGFNMNDYVNNKKG